MYIYIIYIYIYLRSIAMWFSSQGESRKPGWACKVSVIAPTFNKRPKRTNRNSLPVAAADVLPIFLDFVLVVFVFFLLIINGYVVHSSLTDQYHMMFRSQIQESIVFPLRIISWFTLCDVLYPHSVN